MKIPLPCNDKNTLQRQNNLIKLKNYYIVKLQKLNKNILYRQFYFVISL